MGWSPDNEMEILGLPILPILPMVSKCLRLFLSFSLLISVSISFLLLFDMSKDIVNDIVNDKNRKVSKIGKIGRPRTVISVRGDIHGVVS